MQYHERVGSLTTKSVVVMSDKEKLVAHLKRLPNFPDAQARLRVLQGLDSDISKLPQQHFKLVWSQILS